MTTITVHNIIRAHELLETHIEFVCVDALCPSKQFFSHVEMFSCLEPELSKQH